MTLGRVRGGVVALLAVGMLIGVVPLAFGQLLEVKLVSLTSPVMAGASARLTVETVAGADCRISVRYRSGLSKARGLDPKAADAQGRVTWTWLVGTRTSPGAWPVTVTCSAAGRQGWLETQMVVR